MDMMGRPRTYHADRPATNAERQRAYRLKRKTPLRQPGRAFQLSGGSPTCLDASHVPCKQIGPHCTVYCSDWQTVYALLPREAAVVTDPPYRTSYDYTKARRRPSRWDRNYVGTDQPYDPTPWLQFPEVILFGANHYWDRLPQRGSWWCWDKTPGRQPADFAPCEWIWLSKAGPPHYVSHLWRGGMRAGEENYSRLPHKLHPAQKPLALLTHLVQETAAPVVLDPYMGSGTTLAACVRLGRPCIGIELDPAYFAVACDRLQQEVAAVGLLA